MEKHIEQTNQAVEEKEARKPEAGAETKYFSVSTTKLVVMSVATLGLYEFYWFYRNWKAVKEAKDSQISPFWRGLFSIIFCYSLFEHIAFASEKQGNKKLYSPMMLASAYIALFVLERVVHNIPNLLLLLISALTILPLWKAQETIDVYHMHTDKNYKPEHIFSERDVLFAVLGSLLIFFGLVV